MGVSICIPVGELNVCRYFPFGHNHNESMFKLGNLPREWLGELIKALEGHALIMHNAKFDLQVLETDGMRAPENWFDTIIMSWMENENKYSHSLEDLSRLVGVPKLAKKLDEIAKNLGGWEKIPPEVMALYANHDVLITWLLFKRFYKSLEAQEMLSFLGRENHVTRIIQKIENRGILVDLGEAKRLEESALLELAQLRDELGFDPMKPSQLAHRLYAAPPQGLGFQPQSYSARKSKEFSRGLPNMDEDILARIMCPEVEKVLRYRHLVKENSTWYRGWQELADSQGRLHPSFKQHGTKTTRWSCGEPNMHQLPRDVLKSPVKSLIRATPGYQIWEFDYSQQEPRMAVVYSGCEVMGAAFRNGEDIHGITAQRIGAYNKYPDNPIKARYVGKQANLALLYTAGPKVLKWQIWHNARIDVPIAECREFHSTFHSTYPEFRTTNYRAQSVAEAQGYVTLWNKRRRRFDAYDAHKAFNSIIQGGCAQVMIESLIRLDAEGYRILNQVHDAAWIEIPVDEVEFQVPKIISIMEWPTAEFDFPFPVDAKLLAA